MVLLLKCLWTQFAVKVINKTKLSVAEMKQLACEVDILRKLHHKNVTEVIFEEKTASSLYQVLRLTVVSHFLSYITDSVIITVTEQVLEVNVHNQLELTRSVSSCLTLLTVA